MRYLIQTTLKEIPFVGQFIHLDLYHISQHSPTMHNVINEIKFTSLIRFHCHDNSFWSSIVLSPHFTDSYYFSIIIFDFIYSRIIIVFYD